MPSVAELARSVPGATIEGDPQVPLNGATHDSRQVRPGFLFAVLKGEQTDGRRFVDDAVSRGAAALLVDELLPATVPQIRVQDVRRALGPVSAACYDEPTAQLELIGITGTNGKTTTAYLVEAALRAAGATPGVMGTVEYRLGDHRWNAERTTPEAPVVQAMARQMVDRDATHLVMEVSSHGLSLHRLGGARFQVVAFSNLTQDHLDFHRDMDSYAAAKLQLFTDCIAANPDARIAVNLDDPFARTIIERASHPVLSVSCDPGSGADIAPTKPPTLAIDGITTTLSTPSGQLELRTPLLGQHNLSNSLLALGICAQLDVDLHSACRGLGETATVPGRLERIPHDEPIAVLVDYAHTPDALERVLGALRPLTEGRLLCVFGCGGDRDPSKRPLMGAAVARGADLAVVTSDNPRTEKPASIIEMIVPGVSEAGLLPLAADALPSATGGYLVEPDRRTAIALAVSAARAGDTILIAGKGHEDYQILGREKIHFDDREQAREALATRRGGPHG